MLDKIKSRYLEINPEFNDQRYEVKVEYVLLKTKANTVLNCIAKSKFSGKHGKESDVGIIRIFRIHVTDLSLPAGKVKTREIAGDEVTLSSCQQWADTKELQEFISAQLEAINAERLGRSVLGAADAALGNYKTTTRFSSLSVPAELGTWSKADKEFFKWWARDPLSDSQGQGQIYMKF